MKVIKLLIVTAFITTGFTFLRAENNKDYFNLGIGGDFSVTGRGNSKNMDCARHK